MNVRHVYQWCVVSTLLALGFGFGLNKAVSAPPPTPAPPVSANAEQGVQVLARGPVTDACDHHCGGCVIAPLVSVHETKVNL
jgi:hypothetical protein